MHRSRSLLVAVAVAVSSLALASCSSSPGGGSASKAVANLKVTASVSHQLVAAAAALNRIPVSEYSGLAKGSAYYAFDGATGTYWAAAQLMPKPTTNNQLPTRAQVANQDDGSYWLFTEPKGGRWTGYPDGNVGPGTPCPVSVPAGVAKAWGWVVGACRPQGF